MLDRIRRALGRESSPATESRLATLPPARLEGVMPPIAPDERIAKFESEFKMVSGCPHRASRRTELDEIFGAIFQAAESQVAVLTRNPILRDLRLAAMLTTRGIIVAEWPAISGSSLAPPEAKPVGLKPSATSDVSTASYRDRCFSAAVGISGSDWALAETGSLILTSESEGSQLASLAPPVHVALYRREQVVSSLDDVLEALAPASGAAPAAGQSGSAPGRSIVFITGTSRTADIEQTLIRGVHGPRDVHAILVEDACFE